jgi:hypothetical protein
MTEAEWLTCADPAPLLDFLSGRASERKLRLFAVACCRRIWRHLQHRPSRKIVEVCEEYADGRATRRKVNSAWEKAEMAYDGIHLSGGGDVDQNPAQAVLYLGVDLEVDEAAEMAAATYGALARGDAYEQIWQTPGKDHDARWAEDDAIRRAAAAEEGRAQVDLLRCIIGNPFRPVSLDPAWPTPAVVALAEAAYEGRALPSGELDALRLAVLADALEEAGCTHADILSHCRAPGPHVRGCWLLDLLLSKS